MYTEGLNKIFEVKILIYKFIFHFMGFNNMEKREERMNFGSLLLNFKGDKYLT